MIYDINFFIEVKNNISDEHITSSLQDKITKLFSSFECFNENKYNSKYNTNSNKYNNNSKFKSQKNKYKKYYNIEKKNPRRIKNKTDIDIILSYLNKITISNYNDLSIKICDNISDDNYEKIINKLFEISFKQSTYTELYINLYKKILLDITDNSLNNKIITTIINNCNNIINNQSNDLDLLNEHVNKVKLDYDDFCKINKNSKYLKGKINIICNLIKNEIINLDKKLLIDKLFKYKNYNNEIFLVLLQIINNIIGLDQNIINELNDYINTTNFKGKMMIKFKLQDIIDNKCIKDF
jgi:hypothetical protein